MKTLVQIFFKCFLVFFMMFCCIALLSEQSRIEIRNDFYMMLLGNRNIDEQIVSVQAQTLEPKPYRIYLYNTHQSEEYIDGMTIKEVTNIFAQMLRSEGFEVVFETADFLEQLHLLNKQYNQLYTISRVYLQEALIYHGPFDLIVDVHRDSTSRSVSVIEQDGVEYARLMFVVGEKSANAAGVRQLSQTYTDKMNQAFPGIMREPFSRQSQYNQDVSDNMLLLEVGSDQNTSSEALRSLRILVDVLKREGYSYGGF